MGEGSETCPLSPGPSVWGPIAARPAFRDPAPKVVKGNSASSAAPGPPACGVARVSRPAQAPWCGQNSLLPCCQGLGFRTKSVNDKGFRKPPGASSSRLHHRRSRRAYSGEVRVMARVPRVIGDPAEGNWERQPDLNRRPPRMCRRARQPRDFSSATRRRIASTARSFSPAKVATGAPCRSAQTPPTTMNSTMWASSVRRMASKSSLDSAGTQPRYGISEFLTGAGHAVFATLRQAGWWVRPRAGSLPRHAMPGHFSMVGAV